MPAHVPPGHPVESWTVKVPAKVIGYLDENECGEQTCSPNLNDYFGAYDTSQAQLILPQSRHGFMKPGYALVSCP